MTRNCMKCGVELTDDNWSLGVQKIGYYICKECKRGHVIQYEAIKMKYRKEVEEWLAVTISNECKYPYVFYDAIYEIECKVAHILNDMTDDELIDMFYQHSRGWPLEELEADIEWDLAQKTTTCIIRRLDRNRLINIDQDKSLEENLTTVLAVYDIAQLSPTEIDALNPSESGDSEHVLTLALEVLNDRIPEKDEWS